jgi:hypothetical protein
MRRRVIVPPVALPVLEGDEKGPRCLGILLGQSVIGGHKYRDLVLQVGGRKAGNFVL